MALSKGIKGKALMWDDLLSFSNICGETKRSYFTIYVNKESKWVINLPNIDVKFENDDLHDCILEAYNYIADNRKEVVPEIKYTL